MRKRAAWRATAPFLSLKPPCGWGRAPGVSGPKKNVSGRVPTRPIPIVGWSVEGRGGPCHGRGRLPRQRAELACVEHEVRHHDGERCVSGRRRADGLALGESLFEAVDEPVADPRLAVVVAEDDVSLPVDDRAD